MDRAAQISIDGFLSDESESIWHLGAVITEQKCAHVRQAAYHGVPVIGLPFFADQPGNADKAVSKVWHAEGAGLELCLHHLSLWHQLAR